jgi:NDP-sugar pyrophosphorylase family protein
MLEGIIRNLADAGIREIMVNVHHFAPQVIEFLDGLQLPGVITHISDESDRLMDTGGAILQARDFLSEGENFMVHNVDVVTNLDLPSLIQAHHDFGPLATLAVKKRRTSRSLLFDENNCLAGWRHNETGEERIARSSSEKLEDYGNSCIQLINRRFFDYYPESEPLNLTGMYLDLASKEEIRAYVHNADYWYDLGRYENFRIADKQVF